MASPLFPTESSSVTLCAGASAMPPLALRQMHSTPSLLSLEPLDVSPAERRLESQISRTCARRTGALSDLRASRFALVTSFEAGVDSDEEDAAILAAIAADDDM